MKFKDIIDCKFKFLNCGKYYKISEIQCQNCGKYYKLDKVEKINIGKEQFYICNECKDTINKFKQRHKI